MATTLQSRGFDVNVLPVVPQIDARLFNNLGGLASGINAGLGTYNAIQNVADEAYMRPTRRELAQLQLSQARAASELQPLVTARKRAELLQPIERVVDTGIQEVPRYDLQPMVGEFGEILIGEDGGPRMERPAGVDVFSTETVDVYDPSTGSINRVTRRAKPITTVEQAARDSELADYRDALASSNLQRASTAAEAAAAKAETDRLKAETLALRAEAALNDPKWRTVSSSIDADGNLVINQANSAGELRAIPTGQRRSLSNIEQILMGAGKNIAQPATQSQPANDWNSRVGQVLGNAGASNSFANEAEARAARADGRIKNGDKITIAGRSATWRD